LLKNVSNLGSVLKCHWGTLPNERDGISIIAFFSPLICCGVNGQHLFAFSLSARACIKCTAVIDWCNASLSTHSAVGELSLNNGTRFSTRGPQTCSMMTNSISYPAISRSKYDIFSEGITEPKKGGIKLN
jgi:hypothetical protein